MIGNTTQSIKDALASFELGESEPLFVNSNVNNHFIANPWQTAEWVKTERDEVILSALHEINSRFNATISAAYVDHYQDSFYEGIDYQADDTMNFYDARFNYELNDAHFFTFGMDYRNERMRSHSDALVHNSNYQSDSFDYLVKGLYLQDTWTFNDQLETSIAVRIDKLAADFVDISKPGLEIDKTLISPRIDMRYRHNEDWQSRFSIGKGYRAPLSFFESDHGILDAEKGYIVAVTQPERSLSTNYSLNYSYDSIIATLSLAHTNVDHLASLSETELAVPILTQLSETASVSALDFNMNKQVNHYLNLGFSVEKYIYNQVFKESFGIAPIEQRLGINMLSIHNKWRFNSSLDYVASRNLSDYGYYGFDKYPSNKPKPSKAPAYYNFDFKIAYQLNENINLYLGATNLFDYNQARDGSSPLFYDDQGGYDVTYIYAPMRGRTAYMGFDIDY